MSIHPFQQGVAVNKPSVLALAKFSYATASTERATPLNWTHISGDSNLIAVFECIQAYGSSVQNVNERRMLKVQKGSNTLEELDLDSLVQEATDKSRSLQMQNSKPTVAIIIKSPCLAVRYPTRNNQIRRFQIKFVNDADYYKALAILSEVGCPMTESVAGSHQQHAFRSVSVSSQIPPTSSVSATNLRYADTPAFSIVDGLPINPVLPPTEPRLVSHTTGPLGVLSKEEGAKRSFQRLDHERARVSTASSTSSATACDPRAEQAQLSISHKWQPSCHHHLLPTIPSTFGSPLHTPGVEAEFRQLIIQPPSTGTLASPAIQKQDSLSEILPPRRELPFVRPTAKKPRNSVQRTPRKNPLPRNSTSLATASPKKQTSRRSSNNGLVGSKKDLTMPSAGARTTGDEPEPSLPHRPQTDHFPPLSPSPTMADSSRNLCHLLPHYSTALSADNTTSPAPLTSQHVSSIRNSHSNPIDDQREDFSKANATMPSHPSPARARIADTLNHGPIPEEPHPGTITSSDLSSYLLTPTPDRSALVESWVCQQLQDDGFLKLCEDVEGVWRRIAFGH